jgi:hypothetical protein
MKRVLVAVAAAALVGLTALAGSASAAANHPNGDAGAWNMLQDPTMLSPGGPMTRDSPQGNAGMWRAVLLSSGVPCP